jgi:hypothetical protein
LRETRRQGRRAEDGATGHGRSTQPDEEEKDEKNKKTTREQEQQGAGTRN